LYRCFPLSSTGGEGRGEEAREARVS
jgi:hypothetical protein